MTSTVSCLTDERIAELGEGLLSSGELAIVEEHLVDCPPCRTLVAMVAQSDSGDDDATPPPSVRDTFALHPIDPALYEVGREIARGGMGRILEAWDQRHQRRVAIKVLLKKGAAASHRFRREVRITSRLQHPAIIPLYEAGLWPDGEPFFTMRLVSGRPLGAAVADTRTLRERLALLPHAVAVTEALAYAHEQGVVHRDLKPSNVLVGAFGETVVIDWGLAKELDARDAPSDAIADDDLDDAALTVAGSAVGTPCYMAPEQARGEAVDARADVYALGALLYHLFSGKPPFAAGSSGQVLALVLAGPPTPLAEHAPQLAPDLLAIVTKAMARDPSDRYPTAKAMADDLRRFSDGQLVSAHHYSIGTLVGRWIKKHRAAVSVAAVLLVALTVTATLSVRRVLHERDRADQLKMLAEAKQRAAVARRDAAETLVEYMVTDLRTRLAAVGKLDLLVGVGGEVEKYYGSVSALDDADTPASLAHHATTLEVVADVDSAKDEYAAAGAQVRDAIALREKTLVTMPGDREARAALVEDDLRLTATEEALTHGTEALARARHAVELANALVAAAPTDRRWEMLDARAQEALAQEESEREEPMAAMATRKEGCAVLQRVSDAEPDDTEVLRKLGDCYVYLGQMQVNNGLSEESLRTERTALVVLDRLVAARPDDLTAIVAQSRAVQMIGGAEMFMGDYEAALVQYRQCTTTRERLVAHDAENTDWQRYLQYCVGGAGEVLLSLGRLPEARKMALRNVHIAETTVGKHTESDRAQRDFVLAREFLGKVEIERHAYGDALDVLGAAYASCDAMLAHDPNRTQWKWYENELDRLSAEADLGLGRFDAAIDKARAAEVILDDLIARSPTDPDLVELRGGARATLGHVLVRRGDWPGAKGAFERAVADFDAFAERTGFGGRWKVRAPEAARDLARALLHTGDRASAHDRLQKTLAAIDALDAEGHWPSARREVMDGIRADLAALDAAN